MTNVCDQKYINLKKESVEDYIPVDLVLHHRGTSKRHRYLDVDTVCIEPYIGRFGEGVVVYSYFNSRHAYSYVDYYIEPECTLYTRKED